ncbi:MAG: hypothetical protein EA389_02470 [Ilumatobacter sp.]|nr:MAG: hypothetical protein EA389_02470 [Ilumatobacter sp.]
MSTHSGSIQRSFRLSRRTADLLDEASDASGETRNALTDRLLGEAVRTDRHPLIRFRSSEDGRREPWLIGTRLRVRQVITTVRAHGGDIDIASEYLGTAPTNVRAAVDYVADFGDEIERDIERAHEIERREKERWERGRAALT